MPSPSRSLDRDPARAVQRRAPYLYLGLALAAGCAMEPSPADDDAVSETNQDLYIWNSTALWPANTTIPVCFAYSSGATTVPVAERAGAAEFVKERIKLTWGSVLGFNFRFRDCPTSGTEADVLVDLSWHDNSGMCFTAGKGLLTTPEQRTGDIANAWGCHIGLPPDWHSNPDRMLYLQRLVLHEFGHLLGFAHEFNRPDAGGRPCGVPDPISGGVDLGAYDPNSIMLSTYGCRNPDQYWLSAADVVNARSLYGTRIPAAAATKDIVWQSTDGNVAIWHMDGTLRGSQYFVPQSIGTPYKIIGTGDFDGDGIGDLVWRGPGGDVVFWLLDANGGLRDSSSYALGAEWTLQGTGRFNADNRSDLVWRSSATGMLVTWMMNGKLIQYTTSTPFADQAWQVKAVGDFNRDGLADLFWRHSSGATSVWLMNNGTVLRTGGVGYVDAVWKLSAAGDFDGDGTTDLLWHNANGQTSIYFMNAGVIGRTGSLGTVTTDYQAQTFDFDADGKADILWRNTAGNNRAWMMDGLTVRSNLPLPFASSPWSVKGALAGTIQPVN